MKGLAKHTDRQWSKKGAAAMTLSELFLGTVIAGLRGCVIVKQPTLEK